MIRVFFLIFIGLIFVQCSDSEVKLTPHEEEFVLVLRDYYLAKGVVNQLPVDSIRTSGFKVVNAVLEKHKLDTLEFKNLMSKYAADPIRFAVMYDSALSKLNQLKE